MYLEENVTFLRMLEMENLRQKVKKTFLGYSTRSKAYKCLNTNTNKIVESANVKFDEHTNVQDDESIKRIEE